MTSILARIHRFFAPFLRPSTYQHFSSKNCSSGVFVSTRKKWVPNQHLSWIGNSIHYPTRQGMLTRFISQKLPKKRPCLLSWFHREIKRVPTDNVFSALLYNFLKPVSIAKAERFSLTQDIMLLHSYLACAKKCITHTYTCIGINLACNIARIYFCVDPVINRN